MSVRGGVEKALCEPLARAKYLFRRYHQPYCIAVIRSSSPVPLDRLIMHLRKTDEFAKVDETHHAIIFMHIDEQNGGYKAAENVLNYLEREYPNVRFHIGVACRERECQQDTIGRALYALSIAMQHEENYVENDYDID